MRGKVREINKSGKFERVKMRIKIFGLIFFTCLEWLYCRACRN